MAAACAGTAAGAVTEIRPELGEKAQVAFAHPVDRRHEHVAEKHDRKNEGGQNELEITVVAHARTPYSIAG